MARNDDNPFGCESTEVTINGVNGRGIDTLQVFIHENVGTKAAVSFQKEVIF